MYIYLYICTFVYLYICIFVYLYIYIYIYISLLADYIHFWGTYTLTWGPNKFIHDVGVGKFFLMIWGWLYLKNCIFEYFQLIVNSIPFSLDSLKMQRAYPIGKIII